MKSCSPKIRPTFLHQNNPFRWCSVTKCACRHYSRFACLRAYCQCQTSHPHCLITEFVRIQFFWNVKLCRWWQISEYVYFIVRFKQSKKNVGKFSPAWLKMKAVLSFETLGTTRPKTRHITENLGLKRRCCENLHCRVRSFVFCELLQLSVTSSF